MIDLSSNLPPPKPPAEVRVADPLPYSLDPPLSQKARDNAEAARQSVRADIAPGQYLARRSDGGKRGIRQLREESPFEKDLPVTGLQKASQGWTIPEIPNPDDPSGKFDPYAFMPNLVFAPNEDSFPVLPDLDGDGKTKTDAASYRHGVIGGNQPLNGSVSVAKKGEYTVLTYSLYYVDNKFTNYHLTDSSTVAVYLKPGKSGKLEPEYLYTSWHYGANLAPWKDLQKGADGKPVVLVERGSHALHPYGKDEKLPERGLMIAGDGSTSLDGKPLSTRMEWVSPQDSFSRVKTLDPAAPRDQTVMNAYYANYPERTHPIHPVLFERLAPKPEKPNALERFFTPVVKWAKGLLG